MSIRVEDNEKAELARAFVESLADFLKVSILYPTTNHRVQDGANSLIERQEPLLSADGKLSLFLKGDHFEVSNIKAESPKANVAWLADCFNTTNLAGLYFDRSLTMESMFGLTRTLHKGIAVSSTATTFEEFWPEKFEGIRLLERRFRGGFGEFEELVDEVLLGFDASSAEAELVTALLENDKKLMSRMELLDDVITEAQDSVGSPSSTKGVHPLRVILQNLPREAFRDIDTGVSKVKGVLDEVIESIKRKAIGSDSDSLEGLTRTIITRAFHRGKESQVPRQSKPAALVVQQEPEEAAREREGLLAALQELPAELPTELGPEDLDAPAEQLAILFHQIMRSGSQETRARLGSLALDFLKSPAGEELAIMDQFLYLLCSPRLKPVAQMRIAEFAQILQDSEFAGLLTQFKRFSKQIVLDSFPASFGLFIDSIDISQEKEREKIKLICRAIGVEQIWAHKEFLGTRAGILAPERIKKILAISSPEVLPLAQIILDSDSGADTHTIVRYLVSQNLKGAEAAALRVIPSPELLPREYLSDLCNGHVKGSYPPGLSKTSEMLLHNFVTEPTTSRSQIEKQARAIMALGEFPTRDTKELLRTLAKGTGLLGLKKPPKPIHQAAKIVMRMFPGGR